MVAAIDAWLELAERRRIDAAIVEGYTRIPQAPTTISIASPRRPSADPSPRNRGEVKRGEVWWARDDVGARPHLVLTRDAAIPLLTRVVTCP